MFCWYETEAREFNEEEALHLIPNIILGRRVLNPRSDDDYEVVTEAFGRILRRNDIANILVRRVDEGDMNLAQMLIARSVHGWYFCDMLFLRLWCSDLTPHFHELEFLRECMLCGIRYVEE